MIGFFLTTLITALSLLIVGAVVPGVSIATFPVALGAAISIGFVNGFIKPILAILSFPITLLTLGLFALVVNGFCFWFASVLVPGFAVRGVLAFVLGPIVLSVVSTFLNRFLVGRGIAY